MDVDDIKVIVQYKATCGLCTLWQRFGCAACGAENEATAILLVEKKDTEGERLLKAERAARRKNKQKDGTGSTKRKATEDLHVVGVKRPALTDQSVTINREGESSNSQEGVSERESNKTKKNDTDLQWLEEWRAHYMKGEKQASHGLAVQQKDKGKGRDSIVGSAMDDFINAHLYVDCRRSITNLYFDNDQRQGEFSTLPSLKFVPASHGSSFLQLLRTIGAAIPTFRTAAHVASPKLQPSVVTSAILNSLKGIRLRSKHRPRLQDDLISNRSKCLLIAKH